MTLDIQAIRESFERLKPIASQVASRFYHHLWTSHPESKGLFSTVNMDRQKVALVKALATIVEKLDQPDFLNSYLKNMGARHVGYGTQPIHYPWVRDALLSTLKDFLGEGWTPYLESQWFKAINVIAETMIAGAQETKANGPIVEPSFEAEYTDKNVGPMIENIVTIPGDLRDLIRTKVKQRVRQLIKAEIEEALSLEKRELEANDVSNYLKKVV